MKYYVIYLLLCLTIVSGCSSNAQDASDVSTEEVSYVAFLNIDGNNYFSYDLAEKGEYTIAEEFGEVQKKIEGDVIPNENLTSNYLLEGTKIFSVKENPEIFLAKVQDEYEIYKKMP
ncbi:hypothetical protein B481_3398 [Planococcus halocryophilus Or1]|uniref:Uncharacterized protein n=1 Tax=Planococcus halocryophilus TaxID=1215089 RepID=A0A1C7DNT4_9BACL|nr:hypothetical protein [Planococcus halocryophilus]ANU13028.1 hypothetical protein BBI08_03845 [Planococcus halocryophilus]EMF45513.1 hypothetical protein B481_3398 [Planococcus halocryophilus Or1]